MKTITLNNKALTLSLDAIERDTETGAQWRNGKIQIDGQTVSGGGGWILSEKLANVENEERGVNLSATQNWPNAVQAGDFQPYEFGEDESGWESTIMPLLYGAEWENSEDSRDLEAQVFADIQKNFAEIANA